MWHWFVGWAELGEIQQLYPMAMWLWGIGQALVLHNWIAELAALVLFVPIYLYCVSREEQMMIGHFGGKYREYMQHTGHILPKVG